VATQVGGAKLLRCCPSYQLYYPYYYIKKKI
jgi:hypothetical protein